MKAPVAALLGLLAAALIGPAATQDGPGPLFTSKEPLTLTIATDIRTLARRADRSTEPFEGTVTPEGGRTLTAKISARGNSRRRADVCRFPPLRLDFDKDALEGTVFAGQNRLKLVTHCQSAPRYQQYLFKEYLGYALYQEMTPLAHRTRLVRARYLDPEGSLYAERWAFLIEDTDDTAERNGLVEIDRPSAEVAQYDREAMARFSLFQYMIGNLDWSVTAPSAEGDGECCHNVKLAGASAEAVSDLVPVPYDFDSSGLVDAPYAVAPDKVNVASVRVRAYRGFCSHNDLLPAAYAEYLGAEERLLGTVRDLQPLSDRERRRTERYLADFFDILRDPKDRERRIEGDCR